MTRRHRPFLKHTLPDFLYSTRKRCHAAPFSNLPTIVSFMGVCVCVRQMKPSAKTQDFTTCSKHVLLHPLYFARRRCHDKRRSAFPHTHPAKLFPRVCDRHLGSNLVLAHPPSHRQSSCDQFHCPHFSPCISVSFLSFSLPVHGSFFKDLNTSLPEGSGLLHELLHASLLLVVPSFVFPCFFTHGQIQGVSSVQTLVTHRACFSTEPWEV